MMASTSGALKIASSEGPLPTATPHLMPFHIAYSGAAPISTYFRVRPAPEPTYGREARTPTTEDVFSDSQASSDSQATIIADSQAPTSASSAMLTSSLSTLVNVDSQTETPCVSSSDSKCRHFTAAFRGRSLHGLKVDLPEGYAGIVLRAPVDHKGKAVAPSSRTVEEQEWNTRSASKASGRTTRRKKRAEEDAGEDFRDANATDLEALNGGPVRVLRPEARFSSFVLWHPDIPVDEGRDEYLRSLTEWTRLAAEIHRIEDC
ncbi:ribonuclease H2, subunit C [Trametes punicea]|nr:ribonuclease H2, subunit C [Trametes punicea]